MVLLGASLYAFGVAGSSRAHTTTSSCPSLLGGRAELKSELPSSNITAITEWQLPSGIRFPNAVTVAPDGSVWFGEQGLPGVAHFFPQNGTLVEYAWPSGAARIQGSCTIRASIWGIALWKGMVWATDQEANSIIGLNPATGAFETLVLPLPESSPYTLVPGPDGGLWFTALSDTAFVGRVSPSLKVSMYPLLNNTNEIPTDLQFVNSTYAYFTALYPYNPTPSGVYSFDPQNVSRGISPTRVGGGHYIAEATSVAASGDTLWVVQHYDSSVSSFDTRTQVWTVYPTSTENYTGITLPYFVRVSGGVVWFNEHYGNKIAELNLSPAPTLTEFSEANPPIDNGTQVQNDLTIATAPGGLWFTSMTGNYVGFLNASYRPGFKLSIKGSDSMTIAPGNGSSALIQLNGSWQKTLRVTVSDSEGFTSVPSAIEIQPGVSSIPPGRGPLSIPVSISLKGNLAPGQYTVGVTVSDGLLLQTQYLFVNVG